MATKRDAMYYKMVDARNLIAGTLARTPPQDPQKHDEAVNVLDLMDSYIKQVDYEQKQQYFETLNKDKESEN